MSINKPQLKRLCVNRKLNFFIRRLKRLIIDRSELVFMKQHRRKHHQIGACQRLAHADTRAHRKRDELEREILELPVGVNPAFRLEFVGILEICWVSMNTVRVCYDSGSVWNCVFT